MSVLVSRYTCLVLLPFFFFCCCKDVYPKISTCIDYALLLKYSCISSSQFNDYIHPSSAKDVLVSGRSNNAACVWCLPGVPLGGCGAHEIVNVKGQTSGAVAAADCPVCCCGRLLSERRPGPFHG